jgi:hypothetical protein
MDYELAKQLKDAGFPQKEPNAFVGIVNASQGDEHGRAYFPTLEELLEACGDRELVLSKRIVEADKEYEWRAVVPYPNPVGFGSTPTEAVARLWLALNTKPV